MSGEFILKGLKLFLGNAWNRAALFLVVGGIAALNGIFQYFAVAIARHFDITVTVPEVSIWVGFSLIGIGIALFIVGRLLPDRSAALTDFDRHEINQLRALLREHLELALKQELRRNEVTRASPGAADMSDPTSIIITFIDQARGMRFSDHTLTELNSHLVRHSFRMLAALAESGDRPAQLYISRLRREERLMESVRDIETKFDSQLGTVLESVGTEFLVFAFRQRVDELNRLKR